MFYNVLFAAHESLPLWFRFCPHVLRITHCICALRACILPSPLPRHSSFTRTAFVLVFRKKHRTTQRISIAADGRGYAFARTADIALSIWRRDKASSPYGSMGDLCASRQNRRHIASRSNTLLRCWYIYLAVSGGLNALMRSGKLARGGAWRFFRQRWRSRQWLVAHLRRRSPRVAGVGGIFQPNRNHRGSSRRRVWRASERDIRQDGRVSVAWRKGDGRRHKHGIFSRCVRYRLPHRLHCRTHAPLFSCLPCHVHAHRCACCRVMAIVMEQRRKQRNSEKAIDSAKKRSASNVGGCA